MPSVCDCRSVHGTIAPPGSTLISLKGELEWGASIERGIWVAHEVRLQYTMNLVATGSHPILHGQVVASSS